MVDIERTTRKQLTQELQKAVDPKLLKDRDLRRLGQVVITEMKARIAKGKSPIQTRGDFPAYKNPARYPGRRKPRKPVNLKLSGDFLKNLDVKTSAGKTPTVIIYLKDRLSKLKERGHRVGANTQPKRPIIPAQNEKFSRPILTQFNRALSRLLDKLFK